MPVKSFYSMPGPSHRTPRDESFRAASLAINCQATIKLSLRARITVHPTVNGLIGVKDQKLLITESRITDYFPAHGSHLQAGKPSGWSDEH
jgi:hypothetical protein